MKGWNWLGVLEVFVIVLNVSLGIVAVLGAVTGYFGIVFADEVDIPGGMDNEGMISSVMAVIGYLGLTICGIALIGFFVLNFGQKMHKVFYSFPLGFAGLVLLIAGISIPMIKNNAGDELRQMYEDCCAEHDVCCVNDPIAKKTMDDLHRRYHCCAYDGPEYFKLLYERSTFYLLKAT
uniref:23 kDa integral membrane protein n=1 Tax=Lygus hesperus TaxID=30085 RepID=A0A0A9YDZ9_LYGHE